MFIYSPHAPGSLRYAILDPNDPTARAILRQAKAAAQEDLDNIHNSPARRRLQDLISPLNMGQINHLSCMYLISNQWQGATGQGGIWATASRVCNQVARQILRDRPAFEIIEDAHPCQAGSPTALADIPNTATAQRYTYRNPWRRKKRAPP